MEAWLQGLYWLLALFLSSFAAYWIGYWRHWRCTAKERRLIALYRLKEERLQYWKRPLE